MSDSDGCTSTPPNTCQRKHTRTESEFPPTSGPFEPNQPTSRKSAHCEVLVPPINGPDSDEPNQESSEWKSAKTGRGYWVGRGR